MKEKMTGVVLGSGSFYFFACLWSTRGMGRGINVA